MIQKLTWDSDFFGFEIGEITTESSFVDSEKFKLLVVKQTKEQPVLIDGFENTFSETKILFSKDLEQIFLENQISDTDFNPINAVDLYDLAFESGKNSRFLLDKNFDEKQFKELYKKWIDNSLNKQFADKIFYLKEDKIVGFVTIKLQKKYATIGLIAVDLSQQGKGIGKKLLQKAENYCLENNVFELRIPTQKANQQACFFYNKSGYSVFEETIIKHYWRQ